MFVYDTDSDNFLTHLSWALLGKVLQTGRRLSSLTWPMFLLLVHMAHPTNEWTCRTASLLRYTVGKSGGLSGKRASFREKEPSGAWA